MGLPGKRADKKELTVSEFEQQLIDLNPLWVKRAQNGETLTTQEAAFVHYYIATGDGPTAYRKAGFTYPLVGLNREQIDLGMTDRERLLKSYLYAPEGIGKEDGRGKNKSKENGHIKLSKVTRENLPELMSTSSSGDVSNWVNERRNELAKLTLEEKEAIINATGEYSKPIHLTPELAEDLFPSAPYKSKLSAGKKADFDDVMYELKALVNHDTIASQEDYAILMATKNLILNPEIYDTDNVSQDTEISAEMREQESEQDDEPEFKRSYLGVKRRVTIMEEILFRMRMIEEQKQAGPTEVLQYFTAVMRGEVLDQFGLEASLSERTRAAVELAKRLVDLPLQAANKKEQSASQIQINIMPRSTEVVETQFTEIPGQAAE